MYMCVSVSMDAVNEIIGCCVVFTFVLMYCISSHVDENNDSEEGYARDAPTFSKVY